MTISDKIKQLRRVIADEASSENEKEIAGNIIAQFIERGFTDSEDTEEEQALLLPGVDIKFFAQICANVFWERVKEMGLSTDRQNSDIKYITCTISELVELEERVKFFWNIYEEELEIFYMAFVQANGLWSKWPILSLDDLPEEERKKRGNAAMMASGMRTHEFNNQKRIWAK